MQTPTLKEQDDFFDLINSDSSEEAILQKFEALPEHIQKWGTAVLGAALNDDGGSESPNPKELTGGTSRTDAANPILSLIDRADKHLQGLEDSAIERVNSALESSYKDLEAQILRSYSLETPGSLMGRDRALVLLSQVSDLLQLINTRNADDIQQAFEDLLRGADAQGVTLADDLARAIANQPLQMSANVPVAAIVNQATEGVTRLRNHTEAFAEKASTIVSQGLVQGFGTDKVASLLQQELNLVKYRASAIARTESLSASNASAIASYQANGVSLGTWQATQDSRLCPFCAARNQKIYRLEDIVLPAHVNCLPGEIVVSGAAIQAGTSRQYTGEVVVIKTASGKELTATPNHPVLTDQGWVSLNLIQKGDYVFSSVNSEDVPAAIAPDDYQRPTRISEVVAAFGEASSVVSKSVKVSPEDFHGDGGDSKVCVVSADRLLWNRIDAQRDQPLLQLQFKRRLMPFGALLASRLLAFTLPIQRHASNCLMCGGNLLSSLLGSHRSPLERFSFGSASDFNPSRNQLLAKISAADSQISGHSIFGSTRKILRNSEIDINIDSVTSKWDTSFDQAIVDSRLADTQLFAQTSLRSASDVFRNDVAVIKRQSLNTQFNPSDFKPFSHTVGANASLRSQLSDGFTRSVSADKSLTDKISSGSLIDVDASSLEALVKVGSINTKPISDNRDALTSLIRRDQVIHVERRAFSGHVYNLETKTGWYFANNIVTHNCRCFASPASATWLQLGLIDTKWAADFRAKSLAELKAQGLEPNNGVSPFEKANGLEAPVAVWEPGQHLDSADWEAWREDAGGVPCGGSWIKAGHKCSKAVSSHHPAANPNHAAHAAYQGALAAASGNHNHAAAHPSHPDHAGYKAGFAAHGGTAPLPSAGGAASGGGKSAAVTTKKTTSRSTKKAASSAGTAAATAPAAKQPAKTAETEPAIAKKTAKKAAVPKAEAAKPVTKAEPPKPDRQATAPAKAQPATDSNWTVATKLEKTKVATPAQLADENFEHPDSSVKLNGEARINVASKDGKKTAQIVIANSDTRNKATDPNALNDLGIKTNGTGNILAGLTPNLDNVTGIAELSRKGKGSFTNKEKLEALQAAMPKHAKEGSLVVMGMDQVSIAGHITDKNQVEKALKKTGVDQLMTPLFNQLKGRPDHKGVLVGKIENGKLRPLTKEELAKADQGSAIRKLRYDQIDKVYDEHGAYFQQNSKTADGRTREQIYKQEDEIADRVGKLEDQWLGRKPTPGAVKGKDYYLDRANTWAKEQGFTDGGVNGFTADATKAHDIGHPLTHDLIGMDSAAIHKAFGGIMQKRGNKSLLGEEAIVNAMEHMSRGDSLEAAITSGLRVARVLSRNAEFETDEGRKTVRGDAFRRTLTDLAEKAYRNNNFNQYMKVMRGANRISGTVTMAGNDFSQTASGG